MHSNFLIINRLFPTDMCRFSRPLCRVLLLVCGLLFAFPMGAFPQHQSESITLASATFSTDYSGDWQTPAQLYTYRAFTFPDATVWTSSSFLPLTSVIGCSPGNTSFQYSYASNPPFVDISYAGFSFAGTSAVGSDLSSARLTDVSSVTIVLARTWTAYDSEYRVRLETTDAATPEWNDWSLVESIPEVTQIDAASQRDKPFSTAFFTTYTYHFPSPFTGRLRFFFPAAPAAAVSAYNAVIPYFLIHDISVTYAAPSSCDCFRVTIR